MPAIHTRAGWPAAVTGALQTRARVLVTCARNVSPLLKKELISLGFPAREETDSAVVTEGTLGDCMRMNLWLRTAHRVHWQVAAFQAETPDEFYRELVRVPWERWIPADEYFTVSSAVHNARIRDCRYANLKCKDAICDRFRSTCGRRPNSGARMNGACVFVYWQDSDVAVYLDTSGEALSKRGYRLRTVEAPMQETLAAAVILAAGWEGKSHFVNPMCGSGTLVIEAALMATHRAPARGRTNFAFMHLKGFEPSAWARLQEESIRTIRDKPGLRMVASDRDAGAVEIAKENAARAGVSEHIEFHVCDFAATPLPKDGGVIFLNPEYGLRTGETNALIPVYRRIGDFFKRSGAMWRGYVFTGNAKLFNKVSLQPDREWTFFSGGTECRLLEFQIYEGKSVRENIRRQNRGERGEEKI